MQRQEVIEQIRAIIGDYLSSQNIALVDILYRYEGRELFLMILADRPEGGITLDDCAYLNANIGRILDEKNIIDQQYVLEVSSPGIDRPLSTKKDFLRNMGKKVKFFLMEKINGKIELDGIIEKVDEDAVSINTAQGQAQIPLSDIRKAKQVLE